MMTAEQLTASILQLAMEGKLVEQRPEEGTGEELYQQIQAEKVKLVKEGKIKKQKPLPEISEDEKPFEIPESWKWVHLNYIAESSLGKTINKSNDIGTEVPYLCSINVYWSGIDRTNIKQTKFSDDEKKKYRLKKGDLLICEGGDIGRSAIWYGDEEMYYQNALHCVRFYQGCNSAFYWNLLELYKLSGIIDNVSKGVTIKHLVQGSLYSLWMPLPPLSEQRRIVQKIEELMPFVEEYAIASEKLDKLNSEFPDQIKKSILQLAVEGKLVEQRPEEGTGEELFRKIQEEKAKLIKEGKIKKQKPLADITDEEKPFDIPESWKWVRLGDIIVDTEAGKSPQCSTKPSKDDEWGVIKTTAIQDGYFLASENKVLPINFPVQAHQVVHEGDLLITRAGPKNRTGVVCVVDKEPSKLILSDKTVRLKYLDKLTNPYYLMAMLASPKIQDEVIASMSGMAASQVNISQNKMKEYFVPLPPSAEQNRIVARLNQVLPDINLLTI